MTWCTDGAACGIIRKRSHKIACAALEMGAGVNLLTQTGHAMKAMDVGISRYSLNQRNILAQ